MTAFRQVQDGAALLFCEKLQEQAPGVDLPAVPVVAGYALEGRDLAVFAGIFSKAKLFTEN